MSTISEALELFRQLGEDEAHNRQQYLKATRFFNGEQWPEALLRTRETDPNGARPCLTVNVLPHYCKQVTNEMRRNRPSIRVLPVDDGADIETARVLQGIVRHIENRSDADVVYGTGGRTAVIGGLGYWRIATRYLDEEYGLQEICLDRITNPLSVYMSRCDCPAGSDALDVFVSEMISKDEYKRLYGKAPPTSVPAELGDNNWLDDDYVRVAEWYHVDITEHATLVLPNGRRLKKADAKKYADQVGKLENYRDDGPPIRERKIKWKKLNGVEILKEQDLDGRYIPIVRVIGQECDIEGKRYYFGMVRDAIDPQRMRNYWRSCETEMIALAPKAPFVGVAGAFDGFENRWGSANTQNIPYLEYNAVDVNGVPAPMPQRQPAAPIPTAMVQAAANADIDIKAATGIFGAALGEPTAEKSGRAIEARKIESDISTYDYIDNLSISIRHTGRIIVDLIPHVYDTPRVQRILGEDGSPQMVQLQPGMGRASAESPDKNIAGIYDPGVGRYDVEITVGPSFTTKREAAVEAMSQVLQGNPQLWQAIGDLFVKNMDWPGADEISERLHKMVPPALLDDEEQQQEEHNPQDMQMIQQLDHTVQQMTAELEKAQTDVQSKRDAIIKAENEAKRLEIEEYKAQTERMNVIATNPQILQIMAPLVGGVNPFSEFPPSVDGMGENESYEQVTPGGVYNDSPG